MNYFRFISTRWIAIAGFFLFGAGLTAANAEEPCPPDGDFGECKVLVEINAEDGDVGFHFLGDGSDLRLMAIFDPYHRKIFFEKARGPLRRQYLTETFVESAEPLCWYDPEALAEDPDQEIVTLADFIDRWKAGTYYFIGVGYGWEISFGHTDLSFALPAMPDELEFDGSIISWLPGEDLGNCAEAEDEDPNVPNLADVEHLLDMDPEDVPLASYEVVLEPDVDDGDPTGALIFSIRVPPTQTSVTVPADYLASLPADTPVKVEVGAIGLDDNATFAEEDGFCVNEDMGCED